jgi:hypothetical protein
MFFMEFEAQKEILNWLMTLHSLLFWEGGMLKSITYWKY